MKEDLTDKEVEEIVLARYRAEEPRQYSTDEERIAAEKAMDEKWKKIEEYGRKYYASEEERIAIEKKIAQRRKEIAERKKKHDALKHTK